MTCEIAMFDLDEDGTLLDTIEVDDNAARQLEVLVLLRDVPYDTLDVVLGAARFSNSPSFGAGRAWRVLTTGIEVTRQGETYAMSHDELHALLDDPRMDTIREWVDRLTHPLDFWLFYRPPEHRRWLRSWFADEFWLAVENKARGDWQAHEQRVAMWGLLLGVFDSVIERIEAESGEHVPAVVDDPAWACPACGWVQRGAVTHNHCRPARLEGRTEILCTRLTHLMREVRRHFLQERIRFWSDGEVADYGPAIEALRDVHLELADYGWVFAPDGTPISPADWPREVAA